MNADRLDSLSQWGVAFDWETHWIQAGLAAPPPVCAAIAAYRPGAPTANGDGMAGRIMLAAEGADALDAMLADDRIVIVGQNIAFDLLVHAVYRARQGRDLMPAIFGAYKAGRIYECQVAEMLHAIAEGHLLKDPRTGQNLVDPDPEVDDKRVGYRLSVLVDLVLGRADAKVNDEYRERYHELEGVPLDAWPWHAKQYPIDDACNTLAVALGQTGAIPNVGIHRWRGPTCARCGLTMEQARERLNGGDEDWRRCTARWRRRNMHQVSFQAYSAWCLHLGAAWGFRTDPVALDILEGCVAREREAGAPRFLEAGLLRMKTEKGVTRAAKHMSSIRRAVAIAYGCEGECATCKGERRLWDREKDRGKRDPQKRVGAGRACPDCGETGVDLRSAVVPMSDPSDTKPDGQVGTGRDVLFESGDDLLADFAEYQLNDKITATYIPALRAGCDRPWTLRANVLLDTGRVSYSGAAQTLPRNTPAGLTEALRLEASRLAAEGRGDVYVPRGVRDCIRARQWAITVDVPADYELQPGEEWIE